jgi:hypothetical protein
VNPNGEKKNRKKEETNLAWQMREEEEEEEHCLCLNLLQKKKGFCFGVPYVCFDRFMSERNK